MKCRESREVRESQQVTMENGLPATRGMCGERAGAIFRIGELFWQCPKRWRRRR